MHQLRGIFSQYVDAEQLHVLPSKEKFEKTTSITDDTTAYGILVRRPSDHVLNALLLERFLCCAHHAGFRDGVNPGGQTPGNFSTDFQLERVTHCTSRLLHTRGSQCRKPDHIACRVDMRNGGLVVLVHMN